MKNVAINKEYTEPKFHTGLYFCFNLDHVHIMVHDLSITHFVFL